METYGLPAGALAEAARVSLATAKRWKRLGRIPPQAERVISLYLQGDLGSVSHAWSGFVIRKDQLWTPHGFFLRPGELNAIPYRFAQLRALERELATPMQRSLF